MNSFRNAYHACSSFFTRAFDFKGRTNRYDFWIPVLVLIAINIAIDLENLPLMIQNVYAAVLVVPWLSIITRRLRDSGYRLIWLWRSLIPFYFLFQIWIIIYWLTRPSQKPFSFSDIVSSVGKGK